ncbi:VOC family protein [Oscillatoria sp. FACHB-1407]|uniref:VOC family protein n=1 Tax=Oscillatoria sp. FACHB-1407 TaxID=2692847 RepID=UPI001688A4CD|nr:VOC family protein [Oscillatoria sp. FACHB-1407]MBD2462703.1 VOC family protein [Oscillatoria sp. FACHB-1407]
MKTPFFKLLQRSLLSLSVAVTLVSTSSWGAIASVPQAPDSIAAESRHYTLGTNVVAQALPQVRVQTVASVGMTVSDMERALAFYTQVLPFREISDVEVWGSEYERLQGVFGVRMRVVRLQLGNEVIELTDYLTPEGRPIPADSRSNDRWFQHMAIVVSDMDEAYQVLRRHNVQHVSTAPQRLPDYIPAAAGIEAFYFRDPDGHNLEIIYYPPGKGDPRWQQPTDQLFLGIDHTAIAVSNTDTSLAFYRDVLGLEVAGESENYGTEQEHLNNVFGARLRISGLRAPNGMGIEFLEYVTPRDGRSLPMDTRANDLVHWQTTLVVENADIAAQRLRERGYTFVSSDVIEMQDDQLNFQRGFLVRDPDGHVMRIIER